MSLFSSTQGNTFGWGTPDYYVADLNDLTTAPPTLLISINSFNGNFGWPGDDCFAEAFLKHPMGGTGVIAPSEMLYAFGSEWFSVGLMNGLWNEFLPGAQKDFALDNIYPAHANVYAKYFVETMPYQINSTTKKTLFHLFHHFGEPFVPLLDALPQNIDIVHSNRVAPGQSTFHVLADSGAIVSLVLNGEICSVQKSEGISMELNIGNPAVNDTLHITATRQNFRRYHSEIICGDATSIGNNHQAGITIFPNPATGSILLQMDSSFEVLDKPKVYNIYGTEIIFPESFILLQQEFYYRFVRFCEWGIFFKGCC